MGIDNLAERYKGRLGGNTKGISSLTASIKRTRTALAAIEANFTDKLSAKELSTFEACRKTLFRLGQEADRAKVEVKRPGKEKRELEARSKIEAAEAVHAAFPSVSVEDAVAFLSWDHKLTYWSAHGWASSIRDEMVFDAWRHKHRQPNVMNTIKMQVDDLFREVISGVAAEAVVKGRPVAEIVTEALADFEAKRPGILVRQKLFIEEIKAAAIAQRLAQS